MNISISMDSTAGIGVIKILMLCRRTTQYPEKNIVWASIFGDQVVGPLYINQNG